MGWHGNTRAWCMRLTSASLAPALKMVVADEAARRLIPGQTAAQVLSGLCTREFNGVWTTIPTIRAHLRCAFLIMSGGHHVNALR